MKKEYPLFCWKVPAFFLFFLGCFVTTDTRAQLALSLKDAAYELGFEGGPSFFLGDLGGNIGDGSHFIKDLNLPTTKYFVGVSGAMYPASWLGLRANFNFGKLYGNDALTVGNDEEAKGRRMRNLDFRTNIEEAQFLIEVYPTDFITLPADYMPRLRPYFVGGAGVFHFNPQGTYKNPATGQTTWIDLRPLHTEGEGFGPGFPKEYTLWQPQIPVGMGVKYDLTDKIALSGEFLRRICFTDYIDDVSGSFINPALFYEFLPPQTAAVAAAMANKSGFPNSAFSTRGDPTHNDAYFTVTFRVSIKFGGEDTWFGRANSEVKCPVRW